MRTRIVFHAALAMAILSALSPAAALTREELVAKLESAGYSQVSDIKSTAEGTIVKAVKDGKEVHVVVDSSGQLKERR
jgi:peptidase YpeB-like protein